MRKVTVKASSDLALVKYWGKKDEKLRLPENGSVSMILNGLDTVTTVEFQEQLKSDSIVIQNEADEEETSRVSKHLDRIRSLAHISMFAKVVSQNTFPKGTGLSSSGSGFAALTIAGTKAVGLELSERELSILARQGSGTACRCVCGGFVEWLDGNTSDESYSVSRFPSSHWDIRDVVAVVSEDKKTVSSTEGHAAAHTSPFYQQRLLHVSEKIQRVLDAIKRKDFEQLGTLVETETLEFHSILLTSTPPLIAWYPGTVEVMRTVQTLRKNGIPAYFTINTGFNVHVLTLPEHENVVQETLSKLPSVQKTILATVGNAPTEVADHLF
ncbi:MAG TPA: diphosphomevalonate decarboxylase [Patescibacteria group bacterium]|nr:diphosphomevalonate decarboxylase [Patescibacteria group bacterium]